MKFVLSRFLAASLAIAALLCVATEGYAQPVVTTVDGLKDALQNAQKDTTINISGTLTADSSDFMYSFGSNYPDDTAAEAAGWKPYQRVYWFGTEMWSSTVTNAIKDGTLTLDGGTAGATLGLNLSTVNEPGALLAMNKYKDLTLKNLTLTGAKNLTITPDGTTMMQYGGAAKFYQVEALTFDNVTIADNYMGARLDKQAETDATSIGLGGGGMYAQGGSYLWTANFTGTKFTNNITEYLENNSGELSAAGSQLFSAQGGGLYLTNYGVFNYTGGAFSNNQSLAKNARADAGGLMVNDSGAATNGTFTGIEFGNNSAKSTYDLTLSTSTNPEQNPMMTARGGAGLFVHSQVTDSGASPSSNKSTWKFTNTNVHDNSATVDAGNINAGAHSEVIGGGFAFAGRADIDIADSTFTKNTTSFTNDDPSAAIGGNARGGAIAVSDSVKDTAYGDVNLNVANTTFKNNITQADKGTAMGGAVSIHQTLTGTTITSNISGSTFDGNNASSATGAAFGGAIYNVGNSPLTITDTSFTNNTVSGATAHGGAIYSENDVLVKAVTKDIVFSGNKANSVADSVFTSKNLTYDIASGKTITDNDKIYVGQNLTKIGDGDLNINEADITGNMSITKGNADFNLVKVGDSTSITEAVVTVKDLNSQLGTTSLTKSTLVLGDAADGAEFEGTFTLDDTSSVKGGIFTSWENTSSGLMAMRRTQADMSDGFLAAFGMHSRNTVWKAVRDQMISGSGRYQVRQQAHYGQGYYGQESYEQYEQFEAAPCDPCEPLSYEPLAGDPCAPAMVSPKFAAGGVSPNVAWVNYTGRSDAYRSSYNARDWDTSMEGLQVGTDLFRSRYAQLGLFFGSEDGTSTNGWDKIEGDDMYLGVYAAAVLQGGADIRGVFGYGWQEYDLNRWSDNLYASSFKGHTIEGNLEIGKRIASGPWSIRPALGVDVISNEIDGATETGGAGAVKYGDAKMTQLFVRAGTDLRYRVRGFTLNSGIYYAYDVNGGDDLNANVSSLDGLYSSQLTGTQLGRSLLLFNLGGSLQLTRNLALMGGYQGESVLDRDNNTVQSIGYIGGSWKW